jgi:predicted nucleotide-binding protein (sugar kinase/HSP70/actin superfamily)
MQNGEHLTAERREERMPAAKRKTTATKKRTSSKRTAKKSSAKKATAKKASAKKSGLKTTARKISGAAKKAVSRRSVKKTADNVHQTAARARKVGEGVVTAGEIITQTVDFVDAVAQRASRSGGKRRKKTS